MKLNAIWIIGAIIIMVILFQQNGIEKKEAESDEFQFYKDKYLLGVFSLSSFTENVDRWVIDDFPLVIFQETSNQQGYEGEFTGSNPASFGWDGSDTSTPIPLPNSEAYIFENYSIPYLAHTAEVGIRHHRGCAAGGATPVVYAYSYDEGVWVEIYKGFSQGYGPRTDWVNLTGTYLNGDKLQIRPRNVNSACISTIFETRVRWHR